MTLHIDAISAHYTLEQPVLTDITLDVEPCSITAILGPSGSGKTTLFRVLAGLHTPTSGTITLTTPEGTTDLTAKAPQARRVGLVPQEGALFPHLTVAQNIAYGLRGVRASQAAADPRVHTYLELIGLSGLEDRLPHQLSGGQQQRVAVARALAPQPDFVLLDEPFSSLDPTLRTQLRTDLFRILREQHLPTILVTHDPYEALSTTDRIALLRNGSLEQVGTPAELYTRPHTQWAASFLGRASFLPATFTELTAHTPLGPLPLRQTAPDEATQVLVRPEQIHIAPDAEAGDRATAISVQYYGHAALIGLRLEGAPECVLTARVNPNEVPVSIGQQCSIVIHGPVHAILTI